MVFDKIKNVLSGKGNLGDIAESVGLGEYASLLQDVDFPIGKDDLTAILESKGGSDQLLGLVKQFTGDRFNSLEDVLNLLKK